MSVFISILFSILIDISIIFLSNEQPHNSPSHSYQHYNTYYPTVTGETSKYLNFQIRYPNETIHVRVHLSIQLLNPSSENVILTTTLRSYNRQPRHDEDKKQFTVSDAIEAFRKDLIEKETNIGGIIESSSVFFRHFNLKYDNCEISLKCSYYSNFLYRKLNIYCFEHNTLESIEKERQYDTSPLFDRSKNDINITTINIKDYLQTLHMSIQ